MDFNNIILLYLVGGRKDFFGAFFQGAQNGRHAERSACRPERAGAELFTGQPIVGLLLVVGNDLVDAGGLEGLDKLGIELVRIHVAVGQGLQILVHHVADGGGLILHVGGAGGEAVERGRPGFLHQLHAVFAVAAGVGRILEGQGLEAVADHAAGVHTVVGDGVEIHALRIVDQSVVFVPYVVLALGAVDQGLPHEVVGVEQVDEPGGGVGILTGVGDTDAQGIGVVVADLNGDRAKLRAVSIVLGEHAGNALAIAGVAHDNALGGAGHDHGVMAESVGRALGIGVALLAVVVSLGQSLLKGLGLVVVHQGGVLAHGGGVGADGVGVGHKVEDLRELVVVDQEVLVGIGGLQGGQAVVQIVQGLDLGHVVHALHHGLVVDELPVQNSAEVPGDHVVGAGDLAAVHDVADEVHGRLELIVHELIQGLEVAVAHEGGQGADDHDHVRALAAGQFHGDGGQEVGDVDNGQVQHIAGLAQSVLQVIVDVVLHHLGGLQVGDHGEGDHLQLDVDGFGGGSAGIRVAGGLGILGALLGAAGGQQGEDHDD